MQFEGSRLVVQKAGDKGPRRGRESRDGGGSRGPQSDDKCYNCGRMGHWYAKLNINKLLALKNDKWDKQIFISKL